VRKELGFDRADRAEHAHRTGWLCGQVVKTGCFAVADFICPTAETSNAFLKHGPAFVVWVDRILESRFADTNRMSLPPDRRDVRVTHEGSVEY
jgi:adenylylsulfate kinase